MRDLKLKNHDPQHPEAITKKKHVETNHSIITIEVR
ncbi:MAG: hypothetical protein ACI8RD_008115 [Bacillariaceae sp.]|jgi:hypothetical protein